MPCLRVSRVWKSAEQLADLFSRQQQSHYRERRSTTAAPFTGGRFMKILKTGARCQNPILDKPPSFTQDLGGRHLYRRQRNSLSFSSASTNSCCAPAISRPTAVQGFPLGNGAASQLFSSSAFVSVTAGNSKAGEAPSDRSLSSSRIRCLPVPPLSNFHSSWKTHPQRYCQNPQRHSFPVSQHFSGSASRNFVTRSGKPFPPFHFFRAYSPCVRLNQRQSLPPCLRECFSLHTQRPYSSLAASSSLPTESNVKEVKLAPSSLCLMMKWYLEKIGAESSALRCFVPTGIPSQSKASLENQSEEKFSSRSSSVQSSTVGSLPRHTSSIGGASTSPIDGENRGDEVTSRGIWPHEADESKSKPLDYFKSGSDSHTCTRDGEATNPMNKVSENAADRESGVATSLQAGPPEKNHVSPIRLTRDFYEGWIEAQICFGSFPSKSLRDAFRRTYDERLLRWGRLLELLDCFAGDLAYHYCTPHEDGYSKMNMLMVTASIQKMEFIENGVDKNGHRKRSDTHSSSGDHSDGNESFECDTANDSGQVLAELNVEEDLSMIGHVTQSGTSSMGIRIEIQQGGVMKGSVFFVMVAVSPEGRPVKLVPHLDVSSCSPEMRRLIKAYSADFKARKALAKKIFSLVPPDPEESLFLHEIWKKSLAGCSEIVWMKDTKLESAELIQPEALTRYNRAFGGLVARRAFELSYLTAQCFLRVLKPCLRGVDDIFFLEPLYVGDMLHMAATVLWSTPEEIQIQLERRLLKCALARKSVQPLLIYERNPGDTENLKRLRCMQDQVGLYRVIHADFDKDLTVAGIKSKVLKVEALRVDPLSGGRQRTNLFNFRYDTVVREGNETQMCIAPPVYPRDYKECISFLEARRRYLMRREGKLRGGEKE